MEIKETQTDMFAEDTKKRARLNAKERYTLYKYVDENRERFLSIGGTEAAQIFKDELGFTVSDTYLYSIFKNLDIKPVYKKKNFKLHDLAWEVFLICEKLDIEITPELEAITKNKG